MATKKDYTATAAIFAARFAQIAEDGPMGKLDPDQQLAARIYVRALACDFADRYQQDNARFDRERFLTACGLREKVGA